MKTKKVVFVGNDVGACKPLDLVASQLEKTGIEVVRHFAMGKPMDPLDRDLLGGASLVVSGMSTSAQLAERELSAVEWANHSGVPVALFADMPNAAARPWFSGKNVAAVFVVGERDLNKAQECFPGSKVSKTGNPAFDLYFLPPKRSREMVRAELNISSSAFLVLVAGGKSPAVSMLTLGGVVSAMRTFHGLRSGADSVDSLVAFSLHVGDRTPCEFYEDLVPFCGVPLRIFSDKVAKSVDLLAAADMLVSSYTTLEVEAACQRIPVAEFVIYEAEERFASVNMTREWPAYDTDKIVLSTDGQVFNLAQRIEDVYSSRVLGKTVGSVFALRERQEKAWPKPDGEMGNTKAMAAAIIELLERS